MGSDGSGFSIRGTFVSPTLSAEDLSVVRVSEAQPADEMAWNKFVDEHPSGSFFHLFQWRDVLTRSVGFEAHYLVARRHGQIVGVLPIMRLSSRIFGDAMVSLPFCVEAGILAQDSAAGTALIDEAVQRAERARVGYLELRHSRRAFDHLPCKDAVYVNFSRTLAPDVEGNMKAIPRKQRAVVRKGIEAGLISREAPDLDVFFKIYATSVRNLGTPVFPRRYFQTLHELFATRAEITTVYHGKTPVASVFSFKYKNTIMPYYGGGLPLARNLKAYDFMYWEVMRRATESGLTRFDYGRSKTGSGSFAFKKNWGFEPTPLAYEYHLVTAEEFPNRSPNNPQYSLAIDVWKRLPLPLANFLGPLISPYLA